MVVGFACGKEGAFVFRVIKVSPLVIGPKVLCRCLINRSFIGVKGWWTLLVAFEDSLYITMDDDC
jgi:hypothetical protein